MFVYCFFCFFLTSHGNIIVAYALILTSKYHTTVVLNAQTFANKYGSTTWFSYIGLITFHSTFLDLYIMCMHTPPITDDSLPTLHSFIHTLPLSLLLMTLYQPSSWIIHKCILCRRHQSSLLIHKHNY